MDALSAALHHHYGWKSFKDGQRPLIDAVLAGKDALAVLPTGGGKSLCYQLPALVKKGLVLVISPLVALMEDQVMQLKKRGIPSACLHAGLDRKINRNTISCLTKDQLSLIYLAPERLGTEVIKELLREKAKEGKIVAIAVDEAHCISAWGHDFRPIYRKLGAIRLLCPGIPIIALSATAAPKVRADIIRHLNLFRPLVKVCSARRDNLFYSMKRRSQEPLSDVLEALKSARGATLIYVRERRSVEKWTEELRSVGIPAISYHAGLDLDIRNQAQEQFSRQSNPVLVATVAFGMGVDRGDVGLVIHLNLPSTPEGYLQESGRAGRDGLPARCIVFFSPRDRIRLAWAIKYSSKKGSAFDQEEQMRHEIAQKQLRKMEAIAEGELCREQSLLLALGEVVPPCGRCDRCKQKAMRYDFSSQAFLLLSAISKSKGLKINQLLKMMNKEKNIPLKSWGWLIRRLVQEELLRESNDGFQRLFIQDSGLRFLDEPWPLKYS